MYEMLMFRNVNEISGLRWVMLALAVLALSTLTLARLSFPGRLSPSLKNLGFITF